MKNVLDSLHNRITEVEGYIRHFYSNNYVGTVFDNKDPLKRQRIRIKIPQFNNIITSWARPKNNKIGGVEEHDIWIPKINDLVNVEWEGNNPDFPLWSSVNPISDLPKIFSDDYPNVRGYYTQSKFYTVINETKKHLRIGNNQSEDYFEIDISELQESGISKIKLLSHNNSIIEIIEDDNNGQGFIRIKNKNGDMFELDNKARIVTLSAGGIVNNSEGNILSVANEDDESIVGGNWRITVIGNAEIKSHGLVKLIGSDDDTDLDGVITGKCLCHFTGLPHGDKSNNVGATKGA